MGPIQSSASGNNRFFQSKTGPVFTRVDQEPLGFLCWKINRAYCQLLHGFSWQGEDPLPLQGAGIVVCNHLSSVDPFILSACTFRRLSFLIAREYYELPILKKVFQWIDCIPVHRNQQDVGAVRKSLMALKQGKLLCVFPEGGIARGFQNPNMGAAYLSWRSGAPVIPACVCDTPSVDSVWKALVTPSVSSVSFGAPRFPPASRPARPTRAQLAEWSTHLMNTITELNCKGYP